MAKATRPPLNWLALFKESGVAALIALGLSIVMFGLRTVDQQGGLGVQTRWSWVVFAVVSVFIGRLVLAIYRETRQPPHTPSGTQDSEQNRFAEFVRKISKVVAPLLIIFAIALPFLPFSSRYIIDVATLVLTYIMLGWGLNIVVGLAGLLDLGYVAFYAVGAYSYALLAYYFDFSFWICLPLAGIFAATFGIILGFPVLRLRGDYLAIVTLGFGEIIRVVLINWYTFTGGPDGLSSIPRPSFFGLPFSRRVPEDSETFHTFFGLDYSSMHRIIFLYFLILALALITNFFTLRMRKLPLGRAWEALREDETACRSLGINPTNTKLSAFAIGAGFAGFAGSFFATRQGFISPESFTFIESAVILAIVVLGGMGSQLGVVIASILLIGGTELFRGLEEFRMITFGGLMVAVMVWKPRGLLAHRDPTLRLHAPSHTPESHKSNT
ncbi:MAG TPA: branched-chain amino acid ABC transporter permease [Gammaproteobacteria bacterium]|nr:branched-chain amino acid ABC transporter permease [Gammaproteobacteria bacterium]